MISKKLLKLYLVLLGLFGINSIFNTLYQSLGLINSNGGSLGLFISSTLFFSPILGLTLISLSVTILYKVWKNKLDKRLLTLGIFCILGTAGMYLMPFFSRGFFEPSTEPLTVNNFDFIPHFSVLFGLVINALFIVCAIYFWKKIEGLFLGLHESSSVPKKPLYRRPIALVAITLSGIVLILGIIASPLIFLSVGFALSDITTQRQYTAGENIDSKVVWQFKTSGWQPAIGPIDVSEDAVAVVNRNNEIYIVDKNTGKARKSYWKNGSIDQAPKQGSWGFTHDSVPFIDKESLYFSEYSNGKLLALDLKSGSKKWEISTDYLFNGPYFHGNQIYFSDQAMVYAIDQTTGETLWSFPTPSRVSSAIVASDAVVYFGTEEGIITALNSLTGKAEWSVQTDIYRSAESGKVYSRLTSLHLIDGTLYGFGEAGFVYALNPETGSIIWEYKDSDIYSYFWEVSDFYVRGDALIFAMASRSRSNNNAVVYALRVANGEKIWSSVAGENGLYAPITAIDESAVYVNSGLMNDTLAAFDIKTGELLWKKNDFGKGVYSPMIIDRDTLYFGTAFGLYAVDVKHGDKKWLFKTKESVSLSPIISGNVLYFIDGAGTLYSKSAN